MYIYIDPPAFTFPTEALREGGVVGVAEGPARLERCLPPPERLGS